MTRNSWVGVLCAICECGLCFMWVLEGAFGDARHLVSKAAVILEKRRLNNVQ